MTAAMDRAAVDRLAAAVADLPPTAGVLVLAGDLRVVLDLAAAAPVVAEAAEAAHG